MAKYQTANGAPNFNDVVFAFVNLDRNNPQVGVFNVNITQNGSNLFGIQPDRIYNVKNISAYTGADPEPPQLLALGRGHRRQQRARQRRLCRPQSGAHRQRRLDERAV